MAPRKKGGFAEKRRMESKVYYIIFSRRVNTHINTILLIPAISGHQWKWYPKLNFISTSNKLTSYLNSVLTKCFPSSHVAETSRKIRKPFELFFLWLSVLLLKSQAETSQLLWHRLMNNEWKAANSMSKIFKRHYIVFNWNRVWNS